jgi:hypothetical protein
MITVIVLDNKDTKIAEYPIVTDSDPIDVAKENLIEDGYADLENVNEFKFIKKNSITKILLGV